MASSPPSAGAARRVLGAAQRLGYRGVVRPVAWRLDAEQAHHLTVRGVDALGRSPLTRALLAAGGAAVPRGRGVEVLGLRLAHRVGLAAGMDKDGRAVAGWGALGFGHVELGTVTARPQPGNPRPRLVRLPASRAVINRMGFNNEGVEALAARLRAARQAGSVRLPVGVSIGKSKVTPVDEAVEDYLASVRALTGLADYLAVNVSSPNTPGLRSLQDAGPLGELLTAVVRAADVPVLVKVAPDLTAPALEQAVGVAVDAGVRGIIATNTTLSRERVAAVDAARAAAESGGLSGAPLTLRAREVVGQVRRLTDVPVIGVGGVLTGADAAAMVDAGADLVQLYTGLVYAGPGLVADAVAATTPRGDRSG